MVDDVLVFDPENVDPAASTTAAGGGGGAMRVVDVPSVLFADDAGDTIDVVELDAVDVVGATKGVEVDVVNTEDCDDADEELDSMLAEEELEDVEPPVVLSGGATAVLKLLPPIMVDVPSGDTETVSKTVSSTVTVVGGTDVEVEEERGLTWGGGGGAEAASSWLVDVDEKDVVFMNLEATSRGRRPASWTGEYFNAFAVGARMDAKASVAVHAEMGVFIIESR